MYIIYHTANGKVEVSYRYLKNGSKYIFYKNEERHRLNGPAERSTFGIKYWYIFGRKIGVCSCDVHSSDHKWRIRKCNHPGKKYIEIYPWYQNDLIFEVKYLSLNLWLFLKDVFQKIL